MIVVLRLGHRIDRDKRITTHVALVARAFGADKILVGTLDAELERRVTSVCDRFGGTFEIETGVKPFECMKNWEGTVVHLTMYGDCLKESIPRIDKSDDILVVVGAEKVPAQVYQLADWNVSVGNQPHSEVAALAVFLDRYTNAQWMNKQFKGKVEIIPSNTKKNVITRE